MEPNKASTRNAWDAVASTTEQIRDGSLDPALTAWVKARGFNINSTVFSSVCRFDEGIYTGTLVDHHGHAWEFLADLSAPESSDLEDVTANLGPKSPDHPDADLCATWSPWHSITSANNKWPPDANDETAGRKYQHAIRRAVGASLAVRLQPGRESRSLRESHARMANRA